MLRRALQVAQWLFAILVVIFAGRAVAREWQSVGHRFADLHPGWLVLATASIIVLATYAMLVETWRRVLAAWDVELGWLTAARIWFVSSLGKYIPGGLWSVAALGVMAKNRGASPVAAAGSSVIINVLNLASGLALVLVFGARIVPHPALFAVVAVVVVAGFLVAPAILPWLLATVTRLTGREFNVGVVPRSTVWWSLAGTTIAWCTYGAAFRLFSVAILGHNAVHGGIVLFIAAYTAAYILGFVVPSVAGLGVREAGIVEAMSHLGLASTSDAIVVALASRLWLTVLEVVPGLIALAARDSERPPGNDADSRPDPRTRPA